MRSHIPHIILLFLSLTLTLVSQAQFQSVDASQFEVRFMQEEIEFKSNEIISNPLKVVNKSNREMVLTLDISNPPGWRLFKSGKDAFTLAAGDSIFIPTRLVPRASMEGNTKYAINAMIRDEDGLPMGVSTFFCFTKKVVKWNMEVGPTEKIYFKNGEDEAQFDLTLTNTGNYQQDFQLTLDGGNRDDLLLMDTTGNIVRKPTYTLELEADEDTSMSFLVRPVQFKRNFRTVSLLTHRPFTLTNEQRFRYYAISEEAKDIDSSSMKRGTKIDFIRLSNEKMVSPYGSDHLPLNVEARFQNILSDFTVMSLNLNGMKQLSENRRLVYFSQLFFSQSFYNRGLFDNTPWYVGYFTDRYDIQVGNVAGRTIGLPASGKGVTGSYKVNEQHRVGGHFTMNPGFSDERIRSYGVFHDYTGKNNLRVSSSLARSEDRVAGRYSNIASSRVSTRLAKGQNISLLGAYSYSTFDDTSATRQGYLVGLSYSGVMMDRKLRQTINTRYSSPEFGLSRSELLVVNNRTSYRINDTWEAQMLNTYNNNKRTAELFTDSLVSEYTTFNNRLNFAARTEIGIFQPGIFYNIQEQPLFTIHSRGLGFNYSNFNFKKNTLVSTSIMVGYNNPLEFPEIKEYFTARWSMLARVRNLTLNMRYNYGPSNPLLLTTTFAQYKYPKQFRTSLQHQHLFRNTRFVLQSNASYSYNNQLLSHNIGLFPELFYFSPTGWRFSVNASYNFISSDVSAATRQINQELGLQRADAGRQSSNTMRMGVSIRKEIGIPIPFTDNMNHDLDFVSFYDLNGNGQLDKDEPTIENVVVRVHKEEVLTNIKGEAAMKNMPAGNYHLMIQPLDAPEGWFPNMEDSLQVMTDMVVPIPFVRGIKVSGQVVIDLDQRTVAEDERFDLSNIKVAANNGKAYHTLTDFDGRFEFYLPNGDYTITLDENILTSKYRLMQNDIPVTLSQDLENMFVTFFIVEKRRKVNIKKFGQE
jgi:hypothetical protein